jgi:hypothetical protein
MKLVDCSEGRRLQRNQRSAKEKFALSLAETLQERSDEAARRSPAGKRPPVTKINGIVEFRLCTLQYISKRQKHPTKMTLYIFIFICIYTVNSFLVYPFTAILSTNPQLLIMQMLSLCKQFLVCSKKLKKDVIVSRNTNHR